MFADERVTLPPNSEGSERLERLFHEGGTFGGEEGVPCEGGDARETEIRLEDDLPF